MKVGFFKTGVILYLLASRILVCGVHVEGSVCSKTPIESFGLKTT